MKDFTDPTQRANFLYTSVSTFIEDTHKMGVWPVSTENTDMSSNTTMMVFSLLPRAIVKATI